MLQFAGVGWVLHVKHAGLLALQVTVHSHVQYTLLWGAASSHCSPACMHDRAGAHRGVGWGLGGVGTLIYAWRGCAMHEQRPAGGLLTAQTELQQQAGEGEGNGVAWLELSRLWWWWLHYLAVLVLLAQ
jgi:hypothetical protein